MNRQLICRVFGMLHRLEKKHHHCQQAASARPEEPAEIRHELREQEKVLRQMRRVANMLQIEYARSDVYRSVRSLQIFYSLNQMVRSEIFSTLSRLSRDPKTVSSSRQATVSRWRSPACH